MTVREYQQQVCQTFDVLDLPRPIANIVKQVNKKGLSYLT